MYITPVSPNFCAKSIKPKAVSNEVSSSLKRLCEYQGPILKLTPKDRGKILLLNKEIAGIEIDMYKLGEYLKNCKNLGSRIYYNDQMLYLQSKIDILQKEIKDIKTERFLKQKNLYYKRHAQ